MTGNAEFNGLHAPLPGDRPAKPKKLSGAGRRKLKREAARQANGSVPMRRPGRMRLDLPLPTTCPRTAAEIAATLRGLFHVAVMAVTNPDLEPAAERAVRAAYVGTAAQKATEAAEGLEVAARIEVALRNRSGIDAQPGALTYQSGGALTDPLQSEQASAAEVQP